MKHKKVWAAVLAAVLCFAGALTGCKNRDEILRNVNELHLQTASWSSFISIVGEDYDPIKALCIMVFPNRERSFLINIYPNGAVSTFVGDGLKLADAGAVDYEGLKAVVERIEREERDKLKQDVE